MSRKKARIALAVLLLLCAGFTAGSRWLNTAGGAVTVSRLREGAFSGRLYQPESAAEGNPAPAVLITGCSPMERRALAAELSRRGYTALSLSRPRDAREALQWLSEQPFVRSDRLAAVGSADAVAGLAAGESGDLRAQVLLADGDTLPSAGGEAANRLVFVRRAPETEALAAFLDCPAEDAVPNRVRGYFTEESARCVRLTGQRPGFRDRDVQAGLFDWLGSSIGHRIEIPDTLQRWPLAEALGFFAVLSGSVALCLGLCLGLRRKPFLYWED